MIKDLSLLDMSEHARKYGISLSSSFNKRRVLKLPRKAFVNEHRYKKYVWPENERDLFKWNTNQQLVELLGFPYKAISARRNILGVEMDLSISTTEFALHEKVMQERLVVHTRKRKNLEKKILVYSLHEQKITHKEIASQINRSREQVSSILRSDAISNEIKRALKQDETSVESPGNTQELSIEALDITPKLINTLKMAGINTIGELIQYKKGELLRLPNVALRSFADIVIALEKFGLKMRISNVADKQSKIMNSAKAKLNNDLLLP